MIAICVYISFGGKESDMQFTKKMICLLLFFVFICFSSCTDNNEAKRMIDEVKEYIAENDHVALYGCFCDETKDNEGLDEDLELFLIQFEKMDLDFNNATIDYSGGGESKEYKNGSVVQWGGCARIENIVGANKSDYFVSVSYNVVNEDTRKEGIVSLALYSNQVHDENGGFMCLLFIGNRNGEYCFENNMD